MAEPDANPFDETDPRPAPGAAGANAFDETDPRPGGPPANSPEAMRDQIAQEHPVDDFSQGAPASAVARASIAAYDPQAEVQRYATHFGQPVTDFIRTQDNKIIRKVPETGTYAYVKPNKIFAGGPIESARRAGRSMASEAGPAIPAAFGGVGAAAGAVSGVGLMSPALAIAGGATLGASGEVARESADKLAANEGGNINWANVGWQALQNGLTEPVGLALGGLGRLAARIPGVKQVLERFGLRTNAQLQAMANAAAQHGTEENPLGLPEHVLDELHTHLAPEWDRARQVVQDGEALGLDSLSLGQRTRSPVIQKMERWAASTPEGAERMGRLRRTQNEVQVPGAVRQGLDDVAPAKGGISEFREAADDVVGQEAKAQAKEAGAAYRAALDDPAKPLPFSDDMRELFKAPMMKDAWARAQESAANRGTELPKFVEFNSAGDPVFSKEVQPTWRSVDQIKRALDDIANNPANQNKFGKPTGKGADAVSLKRKLLGMVDPINPAYKDARLKFGSSADALDQILQGGIGMIQKMKGPDRLNMVDRIFRGGRGDLMPDDVAQARFLFERAGKADEWTGGLRSYLDDQLDNATRRLQNGGEMGNVAGKMLDVWNTDRQREVLKAAVGDAGKADKLARLFDVLHAASSMLPEASPTGMNAELSRSSSAKAVGKVRAAYGVLTGHGLADHAMGALEQHLANIEEPAARKKLIDFLLAPNSDQVLRATLANMPTRRAITASAVARDRAQLQIGRLLTAAGIGVGIQAVPRDQQGEMRP